MIGSDRVFGLLRQEIREAKAKFEDELSVYTPPECPYCGHETEVGSMGRGEIKFGCYRDDCGIKEEQSEYAHYHTTRATAKASVAGARYDALLDFAHRLAIEEQDRMEAGR